MKGILTLPSLSESFISPFSIVHMKFWYVFIWSGKPCNSYPLKLIRLYLAQVSVSSIQGIYSQLLLKHPDFSKWTQRTTAYSSRSLTSCCPLYASYPITMHSIFVGDAGGLQEASEIWDSGNCVHKRGLNPIERLDLRRSNGKGQMWVVRGDTEIREACWASELAVLHTASLPLILHIQLAVNPVGFSFRLFLESPHPPHCAPHPQPPGQCSGLLTGFLLPQEANSHLQVFACALSSAWQFFLKVPLELTLHLLRVLV